MVETLPMVVEVVKTMNSTNALHYQYIISLCECARLYYGGLLGYCTE